MIKNVLAFFLLSLPVAALSEEVYSPKISLRTGVGVIQNQGLLSGSSSALGGFDLQFHYFLNSRPTIGVGYMAQFDLQNTGVPLSGFEFQSRYYFWDKGTQIVNKSDWGDYSFRPLYAPYFCTLYGVRTYFLGEDTDSIDPTKQLSGQTDVINAAIGVDVSLSRRFDLNMELLQTLLALSSSDPRVKLSETLVWIGFNYVY